VRDARAVNLDRFRRQQRFDLRAELSILRVRESDRNREQKGMRKND
jgi:hypothetical protein